MRAPQVADARLRDNHQTKAAFSHGHHATCHVSMGAVMLTSLVIILFSFCASESSFFSYISLLREAF